MDICGYLCFFVNSGVFLCYSVDLCEIRCFFVQFRWILVFFGGNMWILVGKCGFWWVPTGMYQKVPQTRGAFWYFLVDVSETRSPRVKKDQRVDVCEVQG